MNLKGTVGTTSHVSAEHNPIHVFTTYHNLLTGLDYEHSGHTGFASQDELYKNYANDIQVEQDETTGIVTIKLINKNGEVITSKDLDLDTEHIIKSVSLDYPNKKLVFTMVDGSTTECDLGDLTTAISNAIETAKELLTEKIDTKQPTLISGINIKTVNGESILGAGNIQIDSILDVYDLPTENIRSDLIYRRVRNGLGVLLGRYSKALFQPGNLTFALNISADGVQWNNSTRKGLSKCYFSYSRNTANTGDSYTTGYSIEQYWDTPCPDRIESYNGQRLSFSQLVRADDDGSIVRYTDYDGITQACYKDTWDSAVYTYTYWIYKDGWQQLATQDSIDIINTKISHTYDAESKCLTFGGN